MPDRFLVGNGLWCSCCFPDGPPRIANWKRRVRAGCNECAVAGRIGFTAEEIVAATVAGVRQWRARA
ncbi:hypothetical protein EKPJFOCH_1033 [Methylobacterium thuringiense]|uniref:Uncharacterized protein n=1 Tax=Methylobacterium thuringiense TaxID=1003091 RepID=A0ABQ4TKJ8_9HYPH|nr:hypothetical protein EKPJFOCH_1033 [Methylobacterium thuringiense]